MMRHVPELDFYGSCYARQSPRGSIELFAGKSKIAVMASKAIAPTNTADGTSKSAEKDVREQSETGSGSQQASKRLNRQPAASAETVGQSKKRPASVTYQRSGADKGLNGSSKRPRVSAAIQKGSAAVAGREDTGTLLSVYHIGKHLWFVYNASHPSCIESDWV